MATEDRSRKALQHDPATASPESRRDLFAYYLANFDAGYISRLAALKELATKRSALVDPVAEIMVMKELPRPRPGLRAQARGVRRPG